MHPDWHQVKRLLLVSLLEQDGVLNRILPLIQSRLPQVDITMLGEFSQTFLQEWSDRSPDEPFSTLDLLSLPFPFSNPADQANRLIEVLKGRSFDAAIVFTLPGQSPYLIAYCCYLSGISIRVGQSCEFGGGVLSHCVKPPVDPVDVLESQLHLLRSIGLLVEEANPASDLPPHTIQPLNFAGT
ncbi:hypothetical protein [Leptolyngbya ohadii]|uniref:hypothetical protein n=1 Tax=Leptolyngbya ohadii TaxID=1962290 RepID=UPI000B59D0CA|nr:hypothetical protein [Leptolyngbya ohadii]